MCGQAERDVPSWIRLPACSPGSIHRPHWNSEREGRADAHLALDPDPAAVQLDELPTQGEAKPRTLNLLVRCPDLTKLLEDALLVLRSDADAGVAHVDLDGPIHRHRPDIAAATLGRELDGIRPRIQLPSHNQRPKWERYSNQDHARRPHHFTFSMSGNGQLRSKYVCVGA